MPESVKLSLGLLIVLGAILLIARRVDVRLVLFGAALALGSLAGDVTPIVRTFLSTLSSEQFVIPICTAMGFAQVLRFSGCDQHLVHLLVRPLAYFRPLLVPGSVLVGFLVNISVISQASTAVAVGTVLVPLLRSARLTATTIGSALLLGSSVGGELLNPGAPELNTVARTNHVDATECVPRVLPLVLVQLVVATLVFWCICWMAERRARNGDESSTASTESEAFCINPFKAIVPVVPLMLLMIVGPPLNLVHIPKDWLIEPSNLTQFRSEIPPERVAEFNRILAERDQGQFGTRLIGASMVFGAFLASVASPRRAGEGAKVFFEGAGLAFTQIVSLIVIAQCFGTGIKQLRLDEPIRNLIHVSPELAWPIAAAVTLGFAVLCGSGMAATQSLYAVYITSEMALEHTLRLGAVVGISAAAGRTMSPVAAVVLTSANLTESQPLALVRRVCLPLLAATGATVLTAWWRGW